MRIRSSFAVLCATLALEMGAAKADLPPPGPALPSQESMAPKWGHQHHHGRHHKPMHWAKSPIPSLLPIAERHAAVLHLTPEQKATLATWQKEHRPIVKRDWKRMRQDSMAIRKAILSGDVTTTQPLLGKLESDRNAMMQMKLNQAIVVRKTLTPEQWLQLSEITQRMEHGHWSHRPMAKRYSCHS